MTLSEIPQSMIEKFENGYVPMDEPPGLEEIAYRIWKRDGHTIGSEIKDKPQPPAETWAVVDMLGHRRLAGRISEVERFGGKFLRLDVPDEKGSLVTKLIGASAVYEISYVSETVARAVAARTAEAARPVALWELPQLAPPRVKATEVNNLSDDLFVGAAESADRTLACGHTPEDCCTCGEGSGADDENTDLDTPGGVPL